jgi:YjbR
MTSEQTSSLLSSTGQTLRAYALALPDVSEGVACEGTALEKRTIKTRNKAFVFLGVSDVMVKLRDSLADAEARGQKVGAHGWVTAQLDSGEIDVGRLTAWIDESYRLMAPKRKAD